MSGWATRYDLVCLLCSRRAATVTATTRIDLADGADPRYVARRRCPWCLGRLLATEHREVRVLRPLTDEGRARSSQRGRKPAPTCGKGHPFTDENTYYPTTLSRARQCRTCRQASHQWTVPCAAGCGRLARAGRPHCRPCGEGRPPRSSPYYDRLLMLLTGPTYVSSAELARRLGCTQSTVNDLLRRARKVGVPIEQPGREYRYRIRETVA